MQNSDTSLLHAKEPPHPEQGFDYVSNMPWVSAVSGHGPAERDTNNGAPVLGDGGPLYINGVHYEKGIGCHANSEIVVALNREYSKFEAVIGLDDFITVDVGSIQFQLYGDNQLLYQSGILTSDVAGVSISVDVSNVTTLKLVVNDGCDGNASDHVDWVDAKLFLKGRGIIAENPFQYCGEYTDAETGLIYLRARCYDPSVGRFILPDTNWNIQNMIFGNESDKNPPIPDIKAIIQSSNLYLYAMNNPLHWLDPSGKAVTDWDRNVMGDIPGRIERMQWITNNWNKGNAEQKKAWREEVAGYRATWRNSNEYTDENGITRSTETGGEIKFGNTSQQLGTATIFVKVGYSISVNNQVVLDPNDYRQSIYSVDGGIGSDYNVETQEFTTDGSTISYSYTYSITTTSTVPSIIPIIGGGEYSYKTKANGGKPNTGTFYNLK